MPRACEMAVQAVCSTTVALTITSLAMQFVTSQFCLSTGHVLLITGISSLIHNLRHLLYLFNNVICCVVLREWKLGEDRIVFQQYALLFSTHNLQKYRFDWLDTALVGEHRLGGLANYWFLHNKGINSCKLCTWLSAHLSLPSTVAGTVKVTFLNVFLSWLSLWPFILHIFQVMI